MGCRLHRPRIRLHMLRNLVQVPYQPLKFQSGSLYDYYQQLRTSMESVSPALYP